MFQVEAFSLRTAHHFGSALASQARLRHRVFVEKRHLEHRTYDGLEYDEFDTPGAVYFVWRDEQAQVRGLLRMLPTTLPYMLQSYWPELVAGPPVKRASSVREITRICVDKELDAYHRIRVFPALLCALHEYCETNAIDTLVGVSQPHLVTHYFRTGVQWLGKPALVEGKIERAFQVSLDHVFPRHHCDKLGLETTLLTRGPAPLAEQRAA